MNPEIILLKICVSDIFFFIGFVTAFRIFGFGFNENKKIGCQSLNCELDNRTIHNSSFDPEGSAEGGGFRLSRSVALDS